MNCHCGKKATYPSHQMCNDCIQEMEEYYEEMEEQDDRTSLDLPFTDHDNHDFMGD